MKLNELAYFIMNSNIEIVEIVNINTSLDLFKGNIIEFKRNRNNFKNYIVDKIYHNDNSIKIYVQEVK